LQYSYECANAFNKLTNHNQKILLKYIILYKFGGIFLDLDCKALKSFDTIPGLSTKELILSFTPNEFFKNLIFEGTTMKLLNVATIVSTAKNKYINEIIDTILSGSINEKINEKKLVTKILIKYSDNNISLLNHCYFDSCHSINSCCLISKEAIVNYRYDYSWMNSWIVWILGCVFHLKEDYDHLMSSIFLLSCIIFWILSIVTVDCQKLKCVK